MKSECDAILLPPREILGKKNLKGLGREDFPIYVQVLSGDFW
jgi:hypothetical protein